MKDICASCTGFDYESPKLSSRDKKPLWLSKKDYVEDFIRSTPVSTNQRQKETNQKIQVNADKKLAGLKVLYWAAEPDSTIKIQGAKKAYGNFSNHGTCVIGKNGTFFAHLNCPQNYKTTQKNSKKEESFYRHLHFVVENKKAETKCWDEQIYTQIIVCEVKADFVHYVTKNKCCFLLNVLPCEYYGMKHIPNSYNLPVASIKKMSKKDIECWLEEVCHMNFPILSKALKKGIIKCDEIPIICYCAHKKCDAGMNGVVELLKKGFVRVDHYSGGVDEYCSKYA